MTMRNERAKLVAACDAAERYYRDLETRWNAGGNRAYLLPRLTNAAHAWAEAKARLAALPVPVSLLGVPQEDTRHSLTIDA